MALNIKNTAAEALVEEVARLTGESKTQAVRRSLEERKQRLMMRLGGESRAARLERFLTLEAWPSLPAAERGRRLSKAEEEALLGFGEAGT